LPQDFSLSAGPGFYQQHASAKNYSDSVGENTMMLLAKRLAGLDL
jgi:hypothetical protein